MKRKITDDQLENVISRILADSSIDEKLIDEIVGSPAGWWAVKRNIAQETAAASPWPPTTFWRRLVSIGVPAFAAIVLVLGLFIWNGSDYKPEPEIAKELPAAIVPEVANRGEITKDSTPSTATTVAAATEGRVSRREKNTSVSTRQRVIPVKAEKVETSEQVATEFIALSHAGGPESGQIVRVKVPSSMMVNLGIVPSVEKPSSLVDAEVVVGDDGQNHAIRFIRQNTDGVLK